MKDRVRKNDSQRQRFRETEKDVSAASTFGQFISSKGFALSIAVLCLFFVASCGLITGGFNPVEVNTNSATNSNTAGANEVKSKTYDKEKFEKLLDAGPEIEKMSLPSKPDPKPILKGKVFVFSNIEASRGKGYADGISGHRKANSLEELQTVIRINCRKGKSLGSFQSNSNGSQSRAEGFGIECDVALIDYSGRFIFDQKTFSNNESQNLISSKDVRAGVYLNPPPVGDIMRYINALPIDKLAPEMTLLDEKELIRLSTTISLKPDAALKGRLKIARQYEEGDISQLPVKTDWYSSGHSILPANKFTWEPDELETLVKIVCGKGEKIGQTGKTTQFSNRCEVSLIDYKTLTVVAQKTIENRALDTDPSATNAGVKIWVTKFPDKEIENYLKSLPTS